MVEHLMLLTLEVPDKYLLNQSPEEFAHQLKLNTAIYLYKNGRFSVGVAIDFVGGITRDAFLYECHKRGVEPQTYENEAELQAEIDMLSKEL